jgi:hypothetical protein
VSKYDIPFGQRDSASHHGDTTMNASYIELARLADEERSRTYATWTVAQRRAARLRAAADRCCRTVADRLRETARLWFARRDPAPGCR